MPTSWGAVVRTEVISVHWEAAVWGRYFTGTGLQLGKKVAQRPCLCGDSGKTNFPGFTVMSKSAVM